MYYEEITIDHLDKLAELYVETFNSEPWYLGSNTMTSHTIFYPKFFYIKHYFMIELLHAPQDCTTHISFLMCT